MYRTAEKVIIASVKIKLRNINLQ